LRFATGTRIRKKADVKEAVAKIKSANGREKIF